MVDAPWPARDSTPWDLTLRAYVDGQIAKAAADQSVIDAKGDLIAGGADNIGMRLAVGPNGRRLVADSTAPLGVRWSTQAEDDASVKNALADAKGDLLVGTADNVVARKGAGARGSVLTVDPNDPTGVSWEAEPELARNHINNPTMLNLTGWSPETDVTVTPEVGTGFNGRNAFVVTRTGPNGGVSLRGYFSGLTVGETYRFKFFAVRVAGAAGIAFGIGGVGATSDSDAIATAAQAAAGKFLQITFVATAEAGTFYVYNADDNGGVAAQGTAYRISQPTAVLAREPSVFFTGDDPGCYWSGERFNSPSVKTSYAKGDVFEVARAPELARNLWVPTVGVPSKGWSVNNATTANVPGRTSALGWKVTPGSDNWGYFDPAQINVADNPLRDDSLGRGVYSLWVKSDADQTLALFNYASSSPNYNATGKKVFCPAGQWRRLDIDVPNRTKSVDDYFSVRRDLTGTNTATAFTMADPQWTSGSGLEDYFDGETAGCRWLGAPGASQSIKMLESKADHDMLRWLDAGLAQGVGSPEGRVAAPVGTRYVDTKGALPADGGTGTGAIEWTKVRGGTGLTGWTVTVGDTGWRDVAALMVDFEAEPSTADRARIRRVNNRVSVAMFLRLRAISATGYRANNKLLLNVDDGWRPSWYATVGAAYINSFAAGAGVGFYSGTTTLETNASNYAGNWTVGDALIFEASWLTDNSWPGLSLPGNPT